MSFSHCHRPDQNQHVAQLFVRISTEENATSPALTLGSDASDTLRPTYTTAGTLYNPGTATPIQAPIRRGRNNRWQSSSDLAGLPKSILVNLPLSMHRTQSPATTASSLKHYAPLQQNYDRAATPTAREDLYFNSGNMDSSFLPVPSSGQHGYDRLMQPCFSAADTVDSSGAVSQDYGKEDSEDGDSIIDAAADALATRLNFKSLTSLASYENPSQQIAKRALARGRNSFKCSDLTLHGMTTSSLPPQSFRHPEKQQAASLSQLFFSVTRAGRPSPGSASSSKPPWLGSESFLGQNLSQKSLSRGPKALISAIDTAYPSALSTGPGAPLPLTAGPPGLRQYRPSSLETNTHAASGAATLPNRIYETEDRHRKRIKSPLSTFREALEQNCDSGPDIDRSALSDQADSEPVTLDRPEPAASDFGLPESLARGSLENTLVRGTESSGRINQYYPDQLPPDYTPAQKAAVPTSDWEADCLARRRIPGPRTAEQIVRHQKKVDESWYAGVSRIHQTMDDAITQMQTRQLLHTIGRPEHADVLKTSESAVENLQGRKLSLQDVINTDRSWHAAPLLNMAFSTLLSYVDERGPNKQRSPFMDYREWRDMKTEERHRAWSADAL